MSRVLWTVWLAGVTDSDNYFKSTTVHFLRTDVVATIAVSAFTANLPERSNLIRPDVDTWITEAIPPTQWGGHRYGESNSRWADDVDHLEFNLRVSKAAAAATGIVHDRRDSATSTRSVQTIERALVERSTGAVYRWHTDVTLEGADAPDVGSVDARLAREIPRGTDLAVVDVELSEGDGPPWARYDRERDVVVLGPPTGDAAV